MVCTSDKMIRHGRAQRSSSGGETTAEGLQGWLQLCWCVHERLCVLFHVPFDARLAVGLGVGESVYGACMTAQHTVQVRSLLVAASLVDSVALRALSLEDLGTLRGIAGGDLGYD